MSKLDDIRGVWEDAVISLPSYDDSNILGGFVRPDPYGHSVEVVLTYATRQCSLMVPRHAVADVAEAMLRLVK